VYPSADGWGIFFCKYFYKSVAYPIKGITFAYTKTTNKMKNLEKTIAELQNQRKQLRKDQDAGKNFNGYRDAENLLQAISHLEKAIHLIKLVGE
jgi:membrane protein insertase Oxa1/YidC/SpoIIIJ